MNTKQTTARCSLLTNSVGFPAATLPPLYEYCFSRFLNTIQLFLLGAGLYIRKALGIKTRLTGPRMLSGCVLNLRLLVLYPLRGGITRYGKKSFWENAGNFCGAGFGSCVRKL